LPDPEPPATPMTVGTIFNGERESRMANR